MTNGDSLRTSHAAAASDSARAADTERARDVLQAIIFSEILKPLTAALGPSGATVAGTLAQSLFVRNRQ